LSVKRGYLSGKQDCSPNKKPSRSWVFYWFNRIN
jgi:hypothetical protein